MSTPPPSRSSFSNTKAGAAFNQPDPRGVVVACGLSGRTLGQERAQCFAGQAEGLCYGRLLPTFEQPHGYGKPGIGMIAHESSDLQSLA